jgi:hypothetical protein
MPSVRRSRTSCGGSRCARMRSPPSHPTSSERA